MCCDVLCCAVLSCGAQTAVGLEQLKAADGKGVAVRLLVYVCVYWCLLGWCSYSTRIPTGPWLAGY